MPSFSRGVLTLLILLTAALPLCYSAILDAEERQKEEEALQAATEDVNIADMAPEPPQDLVVDVQSDVIVLLTWQEPSDTTDLDHFLVYVDGEGKEDTTRNTFYAWYDLEACRNYTFGVRSVSAEGDMSDPVLGDGRTEGGRPPPPQNLQGESKSSTTMTLTWEEPDTECDVVSYRVKWTLDGADPQSEQVTETFYTVADLLPSTTYFFSVSGITSEGEGNPATLLKTTAEGEGCPPEDLVAVGVSTSAINVSWSPPPCKPPQYYKVGGLPCMYLEQSVFGLFYLITGLDPCEDCEIYVTSVYPNNIEYSAQTVGETQAVVPPPKSCSVEVQDDYITAKWLAPDTDCALGKYNVVWTRIKLWGDGEQDSGSVNTSTTEYSITYPFPYSEYTFEISASIDGVFGSPASCSGTSHEALPGPPVILDVVSEQGAAVVAWETPAEENGLIVEYQIFIEGGTDPVAQVPGDEHSARVEGLEPCVSVGLVVKARNGAGLGSSSGVEYVTVVDDVLPEEVECDPFDLRVEVCWLPYSDSCPVSRYNLKWEGDVLWSDELVDSNSTTMDWTEDKACYNISALPYTRYSVELTVGSGDKAVKCSAVTPMAAPGPPTEVNATATTEDLLITVTWSEPERKNGIIDFYQVQWEDSDGGFGNRTTEDNSTFSAEIVGLSCGVTVDVTVRAKVVTVDEFGDTSPPVTAYLVNSVRMLSCESSNPGQVSLSWSLKDSECPFEFYNLTWTYDSLWSDDAGDGWQRVEKDAVSTTVTSLPPYSSVSLHIHVDNNPEYKDCNAITPEEAPGPPTEVNSATEGSVIIVTWSEPVEKNGIIQIYQVEWENLSGNTGFHATEDNSTFSLEISDAPCAEDVNVTVRAKVVTVEDLGDASPPVRAHPSNSVKTLSCISNGPGQVSLSWSLKDLECSVGFYNLTWTYDSLWSDDAGEGWKKVGKDNISATVTSLPAYSSVFVQIHVDNNPEYSDCSATTPEEASSKPTSVGQVANSTSSVTVAWGQPLFIRGALIGWRLRWKTMNDDPISEDDIGPEDMTYEVTGLSSSTSYVVYVMALNGAGEGEPEKTTATTAHSSAPSSSSSNTGLIIGLSVGGGVLLILLLVGGFILYQKKGSSKNLHSASNTSEAADADTDELYRMQHLSSSNHDFQNKSGSVDFGTSSELYMSPPPLSKHELDPGTKIPPANDRGPMFGAPPTRRFSQQVATSLPSREAYDRRPSLQVNSRMRNYEEYNRRPSHQDMIGRPSLSGGPGKPTLGEFSRRPPQQIDVGRPNMKEYGRRPSQQADLGRPMMAAYGRRPSQQADLGRPMMAAYGRRPSQLADLGKPRLGEYGRRPSQQADLGRPMLAAYGRRPSQQADIGRPISGEFARRPSQQVPAVGGSFPTRLPQQGPSGRSSVDLYKRRASQQAQPPRPGDRMFMKRPSQQFVRTFEGIEEL